MNVTVYAREAMEDLLRQGKFPENTVVISFYDSVYTPVDYGKVCEHVFFIAVDDLDLDVLKHKGYTYDTYFPECDEAAEFIYQAYQNGMDIICQCDYGQSRSAGCAAAILEYFYHTGINIFSDYRYYPNQVIYHKIYDALEKHEKI